MAKIAAKGKLREPEARLLALAIAASMPAHRASTAQIKDRVAQRRELTPDDLKPSGTRSREEHWQQIVGNVVSHTFAFHVPKDLANPLELSRAQESFSFLFGVLPDVPTRVRPIWP
jgi:hypothetical protein